jgi:hypothetical protein
VGAAAAVSGAVVSVVAVSVVVVSVVAAEAGVVAEAGAASESTAAAITPTAVAISATAGADTSARIIDRRPFGVVATHDSNRTKIRCVGQSGAPDFVFGQREIKFAGALIRARSRNWKVIDELD